MVLELEEDVLAVDIVLLVLLVLELDVVLDDVVAPAILWL
jgi:hypothetical protein